jgi:hypothetical protein
MWRLIGFVLVFGYLDNYAVTRAISDEHRENINNQCSDFISVIEMSDNLRGILPETMTVCPSRSIVFQTERAPNRFFSSRSWREDMKKDGNIFSKLVSKPTYYSMLLLIDNLNYSCPCRIFFKSWGDDKHEYCYIYFTNVEHGHVLRGISGCGRLKMQEIADESKKFFLENLDYK